MSDVTSILSAIERGESEAADRLLPLIYDDLRRLAANRLTQDQPGQTLQATALVHEAYLRLVGTQRARHWDSRGHFFAAAAEAMRRILVERARRRNSWKRGGRLQRNKLVDLPIESDVPPQELLALHEALDKLERTEHRKAELVKLRFFAGLTISQAAEVLGISSSTADNDWAYARSWLRLEMAGEHPA